LNAPAWLPVILAAVMLAVAAFSLWRIAMARVLGPSSANPDFAPDAVVLLLALATAGMLVRWMHLLNPGIWALLLCAAGVWLAFRSAVAAVAGCAIAVYMLLAGVAPSTINGSTAGSYTMAGMSDMYKDTTITFPALGIVLSVVLLGYAVTALDRLTPTRRPAESTPGATSAAQALAPRALVLCEVAIVVTMAYAILAKLV
jgi:hypothetical protein